MLGPRPANCYLISRFNSLPTALQKSLKRFHKMSSSFTMSIAHIVCLVFQSGNSLQLFTYMPYKQLLLFRIFQIPQKSPKLISKLIFFLYSSYTQLKVNFKKQSLVSIISKTNLNSYYLQEVNLILYCLLKITYGRNTETWKLRHQSENVGKIRKYQKTVDDYFSLLY